MMSEIGERIHTFIDTDEAVGLLEKYSGAYTGSRFDTALELQSPDPHRFTPHDFAAVATLSVPLSGPAVVGLLERGDLLSRLLADVPTDVVLADASDRVLAQIATGASRPGSATPGSPAAPATPGRRS